MQVSYVIRMQPFANSAIHLGFANSRHEVLMSATASCRTRRASVIATAFTGDHDGKESIQAEVYSQNASIQWLREVPVHVATTLASEADAASLDCAILQATRKQFSNLTLTPQEQIEDDKPLLEFGIDSMIAAEFRTWIWASFKINISFLDILSPHSSLSTLSEFITMTLVEGWK
ncbi:hypothetical protein GGR54DRAFT_651077 [Hypoxylon sp. NC1633]|nr:hypothetical protein GGR54DRAFT_651077 [Hypoxylon sp. NC1633]